MDSTRPSVFLGFAIYRDIYGDTVADLWNAITSIPDYQFQLSINSSANIGFNRNRIVEQFLDSECDYLVFIDQDMHYTPQQLKKLIDGIHNNPDAGIVSGFYIKRDGNLTPLSGWLEDEDGFVLKDMVYTLEKLRDNRGKFLECDLLPTGFMAIRREVFNDVKKPYFHVLTFDDGSEWSSDSVFCNKVRKTGNWKLYLDLSIEVGHIGNYTYKPDDMYHVLPESLKHWKVKYAKEEALEKYGANTKEYWDMVWQLEKDAGIIRNVYETLYNVISQVISGRDNTVLDLGSGPGDLAYMLHCNGNNVTCADISPIALQNCQERGIKSFVCIDVEKDKLANKYKNKFDYIVCTELIEHVNNLDNLMSIVRFGLKPNGVFVVSCPNNRLGPEEEPEHVRKLDSPKLFNLLTKSFEHCTVGMVGGYLLGIASNDLTKTQL